MRIDEDRHLWRNKRVAVVGGIMTLQSQYRRVLEEGELSPHVFNRDAAGVWGKVGGADVIVLFSGTVSHTMAIKARKTAAAFGIPLITVRRSSVSALRKSISALLALSRCGSRAKKGRRPRARNYAAD